jgi:acylphosphatase
MKRFHVKIKGKVQGVFFRKFIKENARNLNLKGWVQNTKNDVEAVFEGLSKDIHKMIILCHKGPKAAEVKNINFKEEAIKGEKSFKILNP